MNVQTLVALSQTLTERTLLMNQIASVRWRSLLTDIRAYKRYLCETYHYVVASVPLMELARSSTYVVQYPNLVIYLDQHIEEERNHDRWLVADLTAIGDSEDSLRENLPLQETIAISGSQYYIINHLHPVGILGYMFALETAPVRSETLDEIKDTLGLPERSLFTLRAHGQEDKHHRRQLMEIIDSLPLGTFERNVVISSAETTLRALCAMFAALRQ